MRVPHWVAALILACALPAAADEPKLPELKLDDLPLPDAPAKPKKKATKKPAPTDDSKPEAGKTRKGKGKKAPGALPGEAAPETPGVFIASPPVAAPPALAVEPTPEPRPAAAGSPAPAGPAAASAAPAAPPAPAPAKPPPAPPPAPAAAAPAVSAKAPALPPPSVVPEPPLLKLTDTYAVTVVRGPLLDEVTAVELESGLRGVAFLSPVSQRPVVLHRPDCAADDDACFLNAGARDGADEVMVASLARVDNALQLRVRRIELARRKRLADDQQGGLTGDRLELKAVAEALLCKQIVPAGCSGEILVDTGGATLSEGGKLLKRGEGSPEKLRLPIGLRSLQARQGAKTSAPRLVPVLREPFAGAPWTVRSGPDGALLILAPGEKPPAPVAAPVVALQPAPAPSGGPAWTRPVGFTAAGLGAVALLIGTVQGARSHSLLADAESSYRSHGGAYAQSDLANIRSADSAASTANLLFAVGGVLLAAGGILAFAF